MKKYSRTDIEKSVGKKLLPKADYSTFETFLKTISSEDIIEMADLLKLSSLGKAEEDMETFLHHIFGLVFMNEFDTNEFDSNHFESLRNQLMRQTMAEYCRREGLWDTSKEDKRLVVNDQPF